MTLSLSEFVDKVIEIMPAIGKELARQEMDPHHKKTVTLPQLLVLNFLNNRGEKKMKDLAAFIGVTTADMTGVVDRLVRSGYTQRVFDPNDRRIIKIRLTPKGSKVIKHIIEKRKQLITRIFGMISQQERENYLKILIHIQEHLKAEGNGNEE